jgi:hypothetical protein
MQVIHEAPVYDDHQELPSLDDPQLVANDNGQDSTRVFESIPKPIDWKEATAFLFASSLIAGLLTICLLFVTVG